MKFLCWENGVLHPQPQHYITNTLCLDNKQHYLNVQIRFNEIYASIFEQGFPDLGPNSVSLGDRDLSTEFTKFDINKGNHCSRLEDEDDFDDYPDDNDFTSHKWVVKASAAIANGEDPTHFPQAVVQTYSLANLHHVHVFEVPYGDLVKCKVETIPELSGLDEKCMTVGWYDFARSVGLNIGDKIHLTVLNPVDHVCVRVERRTAV